MMTIDELARKRGWLVLSPKEAYMKTYSRIGARTSSIYIFRGESSWEVWRISHLAGKPEPIADKMMKQVRRFESALRVGDSFIDWFSTQTKKKSNSLRVAQ